MDVNEVLDVVPSSTGRRVDYLRALSGGRTLGAHLVLPEGRSPAVLKFGGPAHWLTQIRQAAATADELRVFGYPTPRIWASGSLPNGEWWYLQDFVEGEVLTDEDFGPDQLAQVVELLRRNRGLATPTRQDWSVGVLSLVFDHEHDWAHLETLGPGVGSFLAALAERMEPLRGVALSHDDLVLGDLAPSNLVFDGGHIVGVVDFECAGRGDLAYDVAGLMGRFRDRPGLVDQLRSQDFTGGDSSVFRVCGVAHVLRGVNFELGLGSPEADVLATAEATLEFFWSLEAC